MLRHADHRTLHLEVEAERRQQRRERLAQRQLLQLAAERPLDVGVDRQAERRAHHEQLQRLLDRLRLGKRQRQPARRVERRLALVDLGDRHRAQLLAVGRTDR